LIPSDTRNRYWNIGRPFESVPSWTAMQRPRNTRFEESTISERFTTLRLVADTIVVVARNARQDQSPQLLTLLPNLLRPGRWKAFSLPEPFKSFILPRHMTGCRNRLPYRRDGSWECKSSSGMLPAFVDGTPHVESFPEVRSGHLGLFQTSLVPNSRLCQLGTGHSPGGDRRK